MHAKVISARDALHSAQAGCTWKGDKSAFGFACTESQADCGADPLLTLFSIHWAMLVPWKGESRAPHHLLGPGLQECMNKTLTRNTRPINNHTNAMAPSLSKRTTWGSSLYFQWTAHSTETPSPPPPPPSPLGARRQSCPTCPPHRECITQYSGLPGDSCRGAQLAAID